jgi:hypothetical protein
LGVFPRIHRVEICAVLLPFVLGILCLGGGGGCANLNKKAARLNADTHKQTAAIKSSTQQAVGYIDSAAGKVRSATTQPGVPAKVTTTLNSAGEDLGKAKQSLAPIPGAVNQINDNSDRQEATTAAAVAETKKVKQSWGYRIEEFVKFGLPILLVVGAIVAFIIKTNGASPLFAAFGEIAGDVVSALWSGIKFLGTALLHLFTLGSLKLADKVNEHYDAQEQKKKTPSSAVGEGGA